MIFYTIRNHDNLYFLYINGDIIRHALRSKEQCMMYIKKYNKRINLEVPYTYTIWISIIKDLFIKNKK